jgi:glycosyltransferase involved in cell wall biosynthesis
MRIAVLAHNLRVAGGMSVGKNIVALLPVVGPEHTYLMLIPEGLGYARHENQKRVAIHEVPGMSFVKRLRFDSCYLPRLIKEFDPDIVWALGNLGLQKPPCKQAILIHQPHLVYSSRHYGKMCFSERVKIMCLVKHWVRRSLKHTDMIFCQTPIMCERFSRSFKYPVSNIEIMPNAVSRFSQVDKQDADLPEVFKSKDYYNLFFLTKYYAHKNLEILIELFLKYPKELENVRCIITISDDQHPSVPSFLSDIRKYNLQEQIVNVGPLDQMELQGYFLNSDALLFPSLLESFSGTYLEAMHFGLPILTSDLDFAHYICGDSALYFDPWNSSDIKDKIITLKNNHSLQKTLISSGKDRIFSFFRTWESITDTALSQLESLNN